MTMFTDVTAAEKIDINYNILEYNCKNMLNYIFLQNRKIYYV